MPNTALQRLLDGNLRYRAQHSTLDESAARRIEVAHGQHPFAAIFSCVDSRVPPELIFDQGLGDLFVVRTAGEVLDRAVLGSLEFGVANLHIPLILVLGHESCGAVRAAIESLERQQPAEAEIEFLVEALAPAVRQNERSSDERLQQAGQAQVALIVAQLKISPILSAAVAAGTLLIVGGWYHLESGEVEIIG